MRPTVVSEAVIPQEKELIMMRLLTMLYQSHQRNQDGGRVMVIAGHSSGQVGRGQPRYQISAALIPTTFHHHHQHHHQHHQQHYNYNNNLKTSCVFTRKPAFILQLVWC